MTLSEKKTQRQLIGIDKFRNSTLHGANVNGRGMWVYPTGFGKTFQTSLLLQQMLARRPELTGIILVHRDELRRMWKELLSSKFPNANFGVYTPNEILNSKVLYQTDFLIVDEIHRFYGPEFINCINGNIIKFKWNLGLTATPRDSEQRYKLILDLYPILDEITEEEALRESYISRYTEYNLGLELTSNEKFKYDMYSLKITEQLPKFGKDSLYFAQRCLTGGIDNSKRYYNALTWAHSLAIERGWSDNLDLRKEVNREINDTWHPSKIIGYAKILMDSIQGRKNILYNSKVKVDTVVELVKKFDTLKTICFSQSTTFADEVTKNVNLAFDSKVEAVTYHTALKTTFLYDSNNEIITYKNGNPKKFSAKALKKYAIDNIRNNNSRILSTASALDDGLDIPNIRFGITASGTQNFTQHKQRTGRVKRIENYLDNSIQVLLVNLYFKDTKDEDWLRERQKTSNNPIYWAKSVGDIIYNAPPSIKPTVKPRFIQLKNF